MAKSTPFACDDCGWGGTHPCVAGQIDSKVWLRQIPLGRWHASRSKKYKKLKDAESNRTTNNAV